MRYQDDAVDGDPDEQHCAETNQKFPTAAELRDVVREALAKRKFPFELAADVSGKNFVPFQAFDEIGRASCRERVWTVV